MESVTSLMWDYIMLDKTESERDRMLQQWSERRDQIFEGELDKAYTRTDKN